jgi:hypothetical protein
LRTNRGTPRGYPNFAWLPIVGNMHGRAEIGVVRCDAGETIHFMKSHALAAIIAVLPLLSLGCGTTSEDCSKVIAVHNAQAEASKSIDTDKPGGSEKMAALMDKTNGDMAALSLKDDGVKTKTAAVIDTSKAFTAAYKDMFSTMKAIEDHTKEPIGDNVQAFTDKTNTLSKQMDTATAAVEKAKGTKKAAEDDFDQYCGATTVTSK